MSEQVVSLTPTPWAINCEQHGQAFLTDAEYERQLGDPERTWECPVCGNSAEFDDENFEARTEEVGDEPTEDDAIEDDDIPF